MTCLNPTSGNLFASYITPELDCDVLPDNPVWMPNRQLSGFFTDTPDGITTKELNGTRDVTGFNRGRKTPTGEIATAMSIGSHDELFEQELQGSWSGGLVVSGLTVDVNATARTITDLSATFVTDGVEIGSLIKLPELSGQNSNGALVTAVTETEITISGAEWLQDETGVAATLNVGEKLKVGTTRRTFSVMGVFNIGSGNFEYHIITGVEFTDYSGSAALNAAVEMTHTATGRTYLTPTNAEPAGSTYLEPTDSLIIDDLSCVVFIGDGKARLASSFEFAATGNVTPSGELGSDGVAYMDYATFENTLSVGSVYIDKEDFIKFQNDELTKVSMIASNNDGAMSWNYHKCHYINANPAVEGAGVITQAFEFQPVYDQTQNTSLTIQRIVLA